MRGVRDSDIKHDRAIDKETVLASLSIKDYYESQLSSFKESGNGQAQALCPEHDDHHPSLSIDLKTGLFKCFGCDFEGDVFTFHRRKHNLSFREAVKELAAFAGIAEPQKKTIVKGYDYTDARGNLIFQVVRYEPKGFAQRQPDGKGGWIYNLKDVTTVPYNLPEVIKAETVFITEGEKDVETLRQIGLVATTNPQGARKWREHFNRYFADKHVVILPDNDEPGRKHAEDVAGNLKGSTRSIKVVDLPGLPDKGDVSDWIATGGTKDDLLALVQDCPVGTPETEPRKPYLSCKEILDDNEEQQPYVWDGVIPQHTLVGLMGPQGSMKSYTTLAFAIHLVAGQSFIGRSTTAVVCTIFDKENPRKLYRQRLRQLTEEDEKVTGDLRIMTYWGPQDPPALDAEGETFYAKYAQENPGSVMIFDSFTRFIPAGMDENSTKDMKQVMGILKGLTKWVTVIFLHHVDKGTKTWYRGSSDIAAALDLGFLIERNKAKNQLTLACKKNRFDPEDSILIDVQESTDGKMIFVDMAGVEELKKRRGKRDDIEKLATLVREITIEKGQCSKGYLANAADARYGWKRRRFEAVSNAGLGQVWTCRQDKLGTPAYYHLINYLATPVILVHATGRQNKQDLAQGHCTGSVPDKDVTKRNNNRIDLVHSKNNRVEQGVQTPKTDLVHPAHTPIRVCRVQGMGGRDQAEDFLLEEDDIPDVQGERLNP